MTDEKAWWPRDPSAQPFGDWKRIAHCAPDGLRVFAFGQRSHYRAVTKAREYVVLSQTLRVGLAELSVHTVPEFTQTHPATVHARLPSLASVAAPRACEP